MSGPLNYDFTRISLDKAGIDFDLSKEQFQRICLYFDRRQRWSTAHNLAGPKSLEDPITDLIDACALHHTIRECPLVDVGTGSGTPGILLGCIRPELSILLVEPLAKRTAFLRSIVHELDLSLIKVLRSKWPCEYVHEDVQVVSRAVVSPETWPTLAKSAGESVGSIIRMLAQRRPEMTLENFHLADSTDYQMRDRSERRIERWDRRES